ncbi:MAG: DUF177 domain-containing protein [Epsilonproteobacteria bacterium]|nr:DUF177 domain-containing protein [Campylobacterota bacterium]
MKVTLRKVGKSPFEFERKLQDITLKGYMQYDSNGLILLDAKLTGILELDCAVCGEEFELEVDEDLKFFISDGIYKDEENSLIDVVEATNGELDIDELIHSEVELIKSDYHCCEFCEIGED